MSIVLREGSSIARLSCSIQRIAKPQTWWFGRLLSK